MSIFLNLGNNQPQSKNQINFSAIPLKKENRHGKHKNPNYHQEYYQKNRAKILTCSHDYYGVKKLLETCLKEGEKGTKIGVKKISLTGTRNLTFSNAVKELFLGIIYKF